LDTQLGLNFGQVHPFIDPLQLLVAKLAILLFHALFANVVGVDPELLKRCPERTAAVNPSGHTGAQKC